jgi:hypothetical protein
MNIMMVPIYKLLQNLVTSFVIILIRAADGMFMDLGAISSLTLTTPHISLHPITKSLVVKKYGQVTIQLGYHLRCHQLTQPINQAPFQQQWSHR